MEKNKNPPVPADGKDSPESLADRDADCGRCTFVSTCPDAHGTPGPCGAFIDRGDAW